ncbi:PIN domain-containing protein [Thioalkalivibrio sp. AKL19]|uniref:PIN domain-containing protein n=1 Tax=Thioalkalivibrio sp. AKL19 TaxID=1266914 RepID=UPI001E4F0902|nr:PIN domain-containing protein [Thioalkalivibrio sp. AKL19]
MARTGLFSAKWTDDIHEEWIRNLSARRPEISHSLQRTRQLMDQAVPDCLVQGYEPLVEGLDLPDYDDRHVLAAAIRAGAQAIITFNLKDFPERRLSPFDLEAMHPDVFAEHQLDLGEAAVLQAAKEARTALRNPEVSPDAYIETLEQQGLVVTAQRLREFSHLI